MTYATTPDQPLSTQSKPLTAQQESADPQLHSLNLESATERARSILLAAYLEKHIKLNNRKAIVTDVSVVELQHGSAIKNHNIDTEQFAASINKLPIARLVGKDVRAGTVSLDQQVSWTADDVRAGAGTYDQAGAPTSATVRELLYDMLNRSGNTAVRALVNSLMGGAPAVNERFKNELGLQHTYLQPLDGNRFYVGNTTARESLANMRGLIVPEDAYTTFVKDALATNIYTDYGVRSQLAGNDYIVLANKVGILDDPEGNNRHDVGVVYNTKTKKSYAYSFMTTAPGAAGDPATVRAGTSMADMGRGLLRFAGDKKTDKPGGKGAGDSQLRTQAVPVPEGRIKY